MPPGLPQVQLVIWSLALLASPGLLLPGRFSYKYLTLKDHPAALAKALLVDRLLFITLTMTSLGLVALVVWDGVFPDKRDARVLGVLPLRNRELIVARLGALGLLALLFCVGLNAIPTVLYGPTVSGFGGASNALTASVAHLVSTTLGGAFVFFSPIAVQGVLLDVAGRQAAERLAFVLQIVSATLLLQMLFFMPIMGTFITTDLRGVASHSWLRLVPTLWFLALDDVMGGRPAAGAWSLAVWAVAATATAIVAAVVLFAATHARLSKRALESRETSNESVAGRLLTALLRFARPRSSAGRATFDFTFRSLVRSRRHGMLLSLHIGVALALIISAIGPLMLRRGWRGLDLPSVAVLSAPLVLLFFSLVGLRALFGIPIEPKANWIWRLREPADRAAAIGGAHRVLVVAAVLPISSLAALSSWVLWGPWMAAYHASVCLAMGLLLAAALCLGLAKIPFTCAYLPGRSRVGILWPIYLTAFTNYAYSTAAIETLLRSDPKAAFIFPVIVLLATGVLHVIRARNLQSITGLRFEETDPEAMFEGFHLSEGLAAETPATLRI